MMLSRWSDLQLCLIIIHHILKIKLLQNKHITECHVTHLPRKHAIKPLTFEIGVAVVVVE